MCAPSRPARWPVLLGAAAVALLPTACSTAGPSGAAPSTGAPTGPSASSTPASTASPSGSFTLSPNGASGRPSSSGSDGSGTAALITAALDSIGAVPVTPVTGFTLRGVKDKIGAGVDETGTRWREPGFPAGGVPTISFGTGAIPARLDIGGRVEFAVAVTLIPKGIPAGARTCDAAWVAPYYRFRTNPCVRLPAVNGFRRIDRVYDNLYELYAWTDHRMVQVSVSNPADVKPDAALPVDRATADRVLLSLLPLAEAAELR